MRTFIKIIAAVAIAALVAMAAIAIFAKILITPERIRSAVVPAAEKALNRDVELGDISVRFFSGIVLHDLQVNDRGSDEAFIRAGRASLRYSLLPLLSLKIVINELRLEEPEIRVQRRPDKSFNFSDLIKAAETGDRPAGPVGTVASSGGPPVSLFIDTVRIERGTVQVADAAVVPGKTLRHRIEGLDITAGAISLDGAVPFELDCLINEAPLSIRGSLDATARTGRVSVRLNSLDAVPFLPYISGIPGQCTACAVSLDSDIEGGPETFAARGALTLENTSLVLDALPDAPVEQARIQAAFNVQADTKTSAVRLESLRLDLNGISVQAEGRIEDLDQTPRLALDVKLPSLDIPAALAALPEGFVPAADGLQPAGTLDVQARLEGPVDRGTALLTSARADLRAVQATLGSMRPALSGSLDIQGNRLSSRDLVVDTPAGRARMDLSADNFFGTPLETRLNITSERLNIDALLQAAGGGSPEKTKQSGANTAEGAEEIGPFDLPVRADGNIKVATAVYRGLTVQDFHMSYRLIDNVLHFDDMQGRAAGGSFTQSGRVDLGRRGLAYQSTLSVQSMQAAPLLSAFAPPLAETFSGLLTLDLEAAGKGTLPEALKKNLACTVRFDIADGRISGTSLSKGLAAFIDMDELRELRFDTFAGDVSIRDAQARFDAVLNSTDVRMKPKGVIGLDGALDMALAAALSPALFGKVDRRGRFAGLLADEHGWSQLPLSIRGSIEKPIFSLDPTALKQQALDSLQQRLMERIAPRQTEQTPAEETPTAQQDQADAPVQAPAQETRKEKRKREKQEKREERRQMLEGVLDEVLGR